VQLLVPESLAGKKKESDDGQFGTGFTIQYSWIQLGNGEYPVKGASAPDQWEETVAQGGYKGALRLIGLPGAGYRA